MEKHSGGAKPKTGTGTTNNNRPGNGSTSGGSQTGAQLRQRSPRRENGYAARANGGGARSLRSNTSNSSTSTTNPTSSSQQRAAIPNSVARANYPSSTQTRSNTMQRPSLTEYSPLRGGRSGARSQSRQNGSSNFSRPVLRSQNLRNADRVVSPSGSQAGDEMSAAQVHEPPASRVQEPSASQVHHISSSSEGSDVEQVSPLSSPESSEPQASASLSQLTALREDSGRPMSMSRDAVLARELLQAEMDQMLERDEEMARQLQADINHNEGPSVLAHPLSMFLPGGLQARGRHFPSIPGRMEGGRGARGTDNRSTRALRLVRGPDGEVRMGFELPGRSGMMRTVMRAGGPRAPAGLRNRRTTGRESESGSVAEERPTSPLPDDSLPADEFDPDERLLGSGADAPDDFLSMMNDPSLMLLMLLLRAPDTFHPNDAGVDLDDYDGLWELAERLGEVRRRGISQEQINRLPTHKYKPQTDKASAAASSNPQCQICLVDFEKGDCLRCIPCKHDFHKDCIDKWLERNATCPICRQAVKPNDS